MTCRDFLAQHSEYLDERLDPLAAERIRTHAAKCPTCGRYDRVVRRGLRLVRQLPEVTPSPDFHARLQHRLFHVQEELAHERFAASGAAAALAIAGVIAFAAWSPLMRPTASEAAPAVATVEAAPAATTEAAIVQSSERLRTPDWWLGHGAQGVFTHTSIGYPGMRGTLDPALAFPGPYSPLVVAPPGRGPAVTAILARYTE